MLLPGTEIAAKVVVGVAVLTDVGPDRGRVPSLAGSSFIYIIITIGFATWLIYPEILGIVKYTG